MTNHAMDATERDILDRFERGELRPAPDADREMEEAREAAHNTFKKTKRVNLRVTERDYMLVRARAREEGIPYQTLLSNVIHKYVSGRLRENSGTEGPAGTDRGKQATSWWGGLLRPGRMPCGHNRSRWRRSAWGPAFPWTRGNFGIGVHEAVMPVSNPARIPDAGAGLQTGFVQLVLQRGQSLVVFPELGHEAGPRPFL